MDTGRSCSLCVMFVSDLWSKGEMRSEVACIGSILAVWVSEAILGIAEKVCVFTLEPSLA